MLATEGELQLFCDSGLDSWKLDPSSILVLQQRYLSQRLTCGGTFGLEFTYDYLAHWCALNATILFVEMRSFPGVQAYGHPSDHFKSLHDSHQGLKSCSFFLGRENDMWPPSNAAIGTLVVDRNHALEIFDSPVVQIAFRGVMPLLAFGVVFQAVIIYYRRKTTSTLTRPHASVLLSNILFLTVIAVFQLMGDKWIAGNLPDSAIFANYGLFLTGSIGGDLFLAELYTLVVNQFQNISNQTGCYLKAGVMLVVFDFASILLSLFATQFPFIKISLTNAVPAILVLIKIVVSIGLYRRSKRVAAIVCSLNEAFRIGSSIQSLETKNSLIHLEANLRKCSATSVTCSILICLLMIFHAKVGTPNAHPLEWVLFWFVVVGARIITGAAQVQACAVFQNKITPASARRNALIISTKLSSKR